MWPHVKWRRINTNHVSHYINSVTVMMDRASKVISTRNHKCVGRWPGVAVTIILSDLLWSRQPRAGDVLNRSYVYICLANSQQDLFYMPFQPKSRDNDASEPLLGACALPCRGCVTPLAPLWASPTSAASSPRWGGGHSHTTRELWTCHGFRRRHYAVLRCVGCPFPNKSESISAGFGTAERWAGVFMALSPLHRSISFTHCDCVCIVRAVFVYIYDSAFIDHELILAFYHLIIQNCEIFPRLFTSSFRFDCSRGLVVVVDLQQIWGVW